jgi:hypothetical protein
MSHKSSSTNDGDFIPESAEAFKDHDRETKQKKLVPCNFPSKGVILNPNRVFITLLLPPMLPVCRMLCCRKRVCSTPPKLRITASECTLHMSIESTNPSKISFFFIRTSPPSLPSRESENALLLSAFFRPERDF